jgi:hypothetical protein
MYLWQFVHCGRLLDLRRGSMMITQFSNFLSLNMSFDFFVLVNCMAVKESGNLFLFVNFVTDIIG